MTSSPAQSSQPIGFASVEQLKQQLRQKSQLKGRQADEMGMAEVKKLLTLNFADLAERPDLLIEHLHVLNDTCL
ncbi:MAG: NADH-quinone oxidoreductase subunit F, partial [Betaproteobacteria bacterium]